MAGFTDSAAAIEWLRSPEAVRARSAELFAVIEAGGSAHFTCDAARLADAADYVARTIRADYPDLAVPFHSRWRHFTAGGVDRWAVLAGRLDGAPPDAVARARIDLAVTSVLLDAGAGPAWRYRPAEGGAPLARSEGLAAASLDLFAAGGFSDRPGDPLRADAAALARIDAARLAAAFQAGPDNPLVGLDGRAGLLRRLGDAVAASPDLFGATAPRPGGLYDYFAGRARNRALAARDILAALLQGLAPIWPGRETLDGVNLGDVWRHPAIRSGDVTDGLVPFHKLSQWLAFSLIEPLEAGGLRITGIDALTGLAEYRNGGLFVDLGVLQPRSRDLLAAPQPVGAEPVVEWRAATVTLLDRIAGPLRAALGMDGDALPLAAILEGGTWSAGRRIAAERRPDGGPPIRVLSDGTVM